MFLLYFARKSCFKQDYTSDRITPDTNAIFYLNELRFSKLQAFRVYYMTSLCCPWHLSKSQGFFPLSASHITCAEFPQFYCRNKNE